MAGRNLRPYPRALVYAIKFAVAAGERVGRVLALNRFAPRVAGVERRVQYVPDGHRLHSLERFSGSDQEDQFFG